MPVTLGKDITITGVAGARSFTVTGTSVEVDVTKFGDTSRKFSKPLADITVEIECVEDPGVAAGNSFTLGGTALGNHQFVVTGVSEEAPIDGVVTYTVSGAKEDTSGS